MEFNLSTIRLTRGVHDLRKAESISLMEAVAWYAGQPHTPRPVGVSPLFSEIANLLNDHLSEANLQKLVPLIPKLAATVDKTQDIIDGYRFAYWAVRYVAVMVLESEGLSDFAKKLRDLTPKLDPESVLTAADAAWNVERQVSYREFAAAHRTVIHAARSAADAAQNVYVSAVRQAFIAAFPSMDAPAFPTELQQWFENKAIGLFTQIVESRSGV